MAFRHGKATGIAVDGNDLTDYFNSASSTATVETAETTTFGKNSMTYLVGQRDGTVSLEGFYDGATNAVDDVLAPILGTDDGSAVLVQYGGVEADSSGLRCTFGNGEATSYEISSPVSDVVAISFEVQADGGLYGGVILHDPSGAGLPFDNVAAALNLNIASVDNGALTSNGFVAQLHVVQNSLNGNAVITVEDSVNNSTFATLGTFATVTAAATLAEQISGTGLVDRYVRINVNTTAAATGSITLAVGFSRLPATS